MYGMISLEEISKKLEEGKVAQLPKELSRSEAAEVQKYLQHKYEIDSKKVYLVYLSFTESWGLKCQ